MIYHLPSQAVSLDDNSKKQKRQEEELAVVDGQRTYNRRTQKQPLREVKNKPALLHNGDTHGEFIFLSLLMVNKTVT